MSKNLKINIYETNESLDIDVKETYSSNDINNIILHTTNPEFPYFVKKVNDTVVDLMVNANQKSTPIIFVNEVDRKILYNREILTKIMKTFNIDQNDLFHSIIYKILLCHRFLTNSIKSEKKKKIKMPGGAKVVAKKVDEEKKKKRKFFLETINEQKIDSSVLKMFDKIDKKEKYYEANITVLKTYLEDFKTMLKDIHTVLKISKNFSIDSLITEAISLYKKNKRLKNDLENKIEIAKNIYNEFLKLEPLPVEPFETTGQLLKLEIETSHYTTGTLFDNLELNSELSFAKYKNFNKIYKKNKLEVKDFNIVNDLIIYRQEKKYIKKFSHDIYENIQVYIKNISNGLEIQVLLVKKSIIHNPDSLFKFLKMEPTKFLIKNTFERGILGNVVIENPKPEDLPSEQEWSSFQTPILADMIMNDNFFKKFLMLNDSEKISRDTASLYVYFHSAHQKKPDLDNIKVGGWNKLSSRFGDLTAVLTPVYMKEKYYINIKILRSFNREILNEFLNVFSKLVNLYNKNLQEAIQYFKRLYPQYEPVETEEEKVSSKENSLPYINPLIFTNNIYSRYACQKHPPVIVDNDDLLDKERIMIFPKNPVEVDDEIIEPTMYYCPDEKYRYPGLYDMRKKVPDHPVGFAPCCYIESHEEKNKKIFTTIDTILSDDEPDEIIEIPDVKKNFINSDENLIKFLGQQGKLPPTIENFLLSIDPTKSYFRIGLDSIWYKSSLLGCCQYIQQKTLLDATGEQIYKKLPLQKSIRKELSSINLSIIKQENIEWSEDKMREYLLFPKNKITFRRFFSLLQYYYKLNILVLKTDGNFVFPNTNFTFKMNYNPSNPLILLLEHPTEIYEIIAFKEQEKEYLYITENLKKNDSWNRQWQIIFEEVYSTREYNKIKSITEQRTRDFMIKNNLHKKVDSQILSNNGQTRFFILQNNIPLFFFETCAPCNLKTESNLILKKGNFKIISNLLKNLTNVKIIVKEVFDFSFFIIYDIQMNKWIGAIPVTESFEEEEWFEKKDTVLPIDNEISILLEYLNKGTEFNEIFKKKHYSLILMDYILLYFSNFLGNSDKELQKTIEIHDIDQIIEQFYSIHVDFVNDKTIDLNQEFSPLFNGNVSIHSGDKIKIPILLESKVRFMLKWNIMNNSSYLKTIFNTNELFSFYQHGFQFKMIQNNEIQISNIVTESESFQPYYEAIPQYKMEEEKVYFLYHKNSITIYPFFYTRDSLDKIHGIMNKYYESHELDFDPFFEGNPKFPFQLLKNIPSVNNLGKNKYIIFDVQDKYYIVLFSMK